MIQTNSVFTNCSFKTLGLIQEGNWVWGHNPCVQQTLHITLHLTPDVKSHQAENNRFHTPNQRLLCPILHRFANSNDRDALGGAETQTFIHCLLTWVSYKCEGQKANELCRNGCLHRFLHQDTMIKQIYCSPTLFQCAYTVEMSVGLVCVKIECIILHCNFQIKQSNLGRESKNGQRL